ncbi:MAG: alpha/beta hydrolase [Alphaproteobacteria bacterium]|nr:alpha/beta hydrolase [Alphaproteobacteria bacterium]
MKYFFRHCERNEAIHLAVGENGLSRRRRLLAMTMGLMLLAACAPQEQAFRPASETPSLQKESFTTADGATLPVRSWRVKRPKAVVIGVHGMNDYSNAFSETGEYFKRRGIATYAYDQRGFGGTDDVGIWAGEANLKRDLRDFTALIARRHPNTPLFVMGESMGGAVAMLAEAEAPLPVSGIILSAPAVWNDENIPAIYQLLLWSAAHTLPSYKLTGKDLNILASNNIPMLRRMGADPLVIKATRIDTIYGLTQLMNDAYATPSHIESRVLLLYGLKDQIVPRPPVEAIKSCFGTPADTIFYDDGYHMLTRDLQGPSVLSDIAKWILKPRPRR